MLILNSSIDLAISVRAKGGRLNFTWNPPVKFETLEKSIIQHFLAAVVLIFESIPRKTRRPLSPADIISMTQSANPSQGKNHGTPLRYEALLIPKVTGMHPTQEIAEYVDRKQS
jgi:hypothetical protein